MHQGKNGLASLRVVGAVVVAGLGLSACATEDYVNKQIAASIAPVNDHINAVEQKADAAMTTAQAAQSTAQAAQTLPKVSNRPM